MILIHGSNRCVPSYTGNLYGVKQCFNGVQPKVDLDGHLAIKDCKINIGPVDDNGLYHMSISNTRMDDQGVLLSCLLTPLYALFYDIYTDIHPLYPYTYTYTYIQMYTIHTPNTPAYTLYAPLYHLFTHRPHSHVRYGDGGATH
jgi:hypothetical protein